MSLARLTSGSGNRPGQDEWTRRDVRCECTPGTRHVHPDCPRGRLMGITRHGPR